MNKARRNTLNEIFEEMRSLCDRLEYVRDEEADYMDNIPENLQGSERYEKAEEAVNNMDEALSLLEDVLVYIESAAE